MKIKYPPGILVGVAVFNEQDFQRYVPFSSCAQSLKWQNLYNLVKGNWGRGGDKAWA